MKSIILTLILYFGFSNYLVSQQKISITPYLMPQVILTGKNIYETNDPWHAPYNRFPVSRNKIIRYSAGLTFEYRVRKMSIGTGLAYSEKGQEYTIGFGFTDKQYKISTDYLVAPLFIKYYPKKIWDKIELSLLGGVYFAKLIHESDNYRQVYDYSIWLPIVGKWYRNNDFGIIAGLGVNYRLNKNILFNLELASEMGLWKLYSQDPVYYIYKLKNARNNILGIKFGSVFEIRTNTATGRK